MPTRAIQARLDALAQSKAAAAVDANDDVVAAVAAAVSPSPKRKAVNNKNSTCNNKKNKATNAKFFFFEMPPGVDDAFFTNAKAAAMHRQDYEGLIVAEKGFVKKASYLSFMKQHKDPLLNPAAKPTATDASSKSDRAAATQIVSLLSDAAESDRFHGYYRTTANSKLVALLFRCINIYHSDTWVFKPDLICSILPKLAEVIDVPDPLLHEALCNLRYGKASDPDSPDKTKALVTVYNPPSDPQKEILLENYRAYTFFTIPFETIDNYEAEQDWLSTKCAQVLRGIRDTMNTPTFRATMEQLGQVRRGAYIEKLYRADAKTNLPKFLNAAQVKVEPAKYFTQHVVQSVCNEIMTHLWNTRNPEPKYKKSTIKVEELADVPVQDLPEDTKEAAVGDENNDVDNEEDEEESAEEDSGDEEEEDDQQTN